MSNNKTEKWEEEFDKKFACHVCLTPKIKGHGGSWMVLEKDAVLLKNIKSFIRSALSHQKSELREKLKHIAMHHHTWGDGVIPCYSIKDILDILT